MSIAMPGCWSNRLSECNTALALDPGNYTFRSCAWAFMELGKAERAADFIRLDAGSEWAAYMTAVAASARGQDFGGARGREAHADNAALSPRPVGSMPAIASGSGSGPRWRTKRKPACQPILTRRHGITRERFSPIVARNKRRLHLLQSAVEQNYCAHENLL